MATHLSRLLLLVVFFMLPSVSSAAALTQQQSTSLIAVVQSSPGTPASAFVSLITAFSNITTIQAASLITVVQAAPGVPANAFVDLLTSFTVDGVVQPVISTEPTLTSSQVVPPIVNVSWLGLYFAKSEFFKDGLYGDVGIKEWEYIRNATKITWYVDSIVIDGPRTPSTGSQKFVLHTDVFADGEHTLTLRANGADGSTAEDSITITIKNTRP